MPTYTYKREDGSVFDYEQRITEPPLETCPTTGQKVKRIISGNAGLLFKGSGFYLTDYVKNNGEGGKKGSKDDATAAKSDDSSSASTSSESKTKEAGKTDAASSNTSSSKE